VSKGHEGHGVSVVRHGHLNNLAKSNGNTMTHPILVTGAAGRVGGVGGLVVEALQRRGLPVSVTSAPRGPFLCSVSFPGSCGPSFWS
jgi:hypothetical protein